MPFRVNLFNYLQDRHKRSSFSGSFLFYVNRNSVWLIYFFDFVKEYLVYLYLFGKNSSVLYFLIVFKIMFEFYFHTFHNKNHYKININN